MTEAELQSLDYSSALDLFVRNQRRLIRAVESDVFSLEIDELRHERIQLFGVILEKQPNAR
jgi:hypothetical protein